MRFVLVWLAIATGAGSLAAAQPVADKPSLLLTDQRMKRLKRDRQRQTERWTNFETRIKNVLDSPERGFELALYFRVTNDAAIAAEAAQWASAHPCDRRQVALVSSILPLETPAPPAPASCPPDQGGPLSSLRDLVFANVSRTGFSFDTNRFIGLLRNTPLTDSNEIYAAIELLLALDRDASDSIRQKEPQFFNTLPVQFLLSLKPRQVDRPDWRTHVAALALIALDPNSDSAQFLQGWAIEDRQMIHDGPGVAYELLWADPYLPGVGYQNLDPWFYDDLAGRLLARTDWSLEACSVSISPAGIAAEQCPKEWQSREIHFGRLQLIPMSGPCLDIPSRPANISQLLWKLPPHGRLKVGEKKNITLLNADPAGIWRVPTNIMGKVCSVR